MPAPTKKTLIAVFVAAAGLAAIAVTSAAKADIPPVQAADAQLAAVETKAGPADRLTGARTDADPAELNAFGIDAGTLTRSFTAGTDAARRQVRRRVRRRTQRRY